MLYQNHDPLKLFFDLFLKSDKWPLLTGFTYTSEISSHLSLICDQIDFQNVSLVLVFVVILFSSAITVLGNSFFSVITTTAIRFCMMVTQLILFFKYESRSNQKLVEEEFFMNSRVVWVFV